MKKSVSKWIALLLSVIMIVMCAAGCSKAQTQQPASDHTADAPAQAADTPAAGRHQVIRGHIRAHTIVAFDIADGIFLHAGAAAENQRDAFVAFSADKPFKNLIHKGGKHQ